ncbi:hypothetical protein [Micromonospora coerulea]|uniref:hypothetical protein n=1 Tax=Micromonospora coerulea TaxID=47856 RepID=UPI001906F04F|nr:hypothetical protein [Micromonospora veneta]
MIVQWCCKGIPSISDADVRQILLGGEGLVCSLWHNTPIRSMADALSRLSERHLDSHLHDYDSVGHETAYISLSAGCVERDALLARNVRHAARLTALAFATDWGQVAGWLFTCYVFVGINPAPQIPAVAEELRELNHARPYSPYYREGEVAAKIHVPSRQILSAENWVPVASGFKVNGYVNPTFFDPKPLVNERATL